MAPFFIFLSLLICVGAVHSSYQDEKLNCTYIDRKRNLCYNSIE